MTDIEPIKKDEQNYPTGEIKQATPREIELQNRIWAMQAKYNALLRKFIGDSTLMIDHDIESEIQRDIKDAREVVLKRVDKEIKSKREAIAQVNTMCNKLFRELSE